MKTSTTPCSSKPYQPVPPGVLGRGDGRGEGGGRGGVGSACAAGGERRWTGPRGAVVGVAFDEHVLSPKNGFITVIKGAADV